MFYKCPTGCRIEGSLSLSLHLYVLWIIIALKSDFAMVTVNVNTPSALFMGISELFIVESFTADVFIESVTMLDTSGIWCSISIG